MLGKFFLNIRKIPSKKNRFPETKTLFPTVHIMNCFCDTPSYEMPDVPSGRVCGKCWKVLESFRNFRKDRKVKWAVSTVSQNFSHFHLFGKIVTIVLFYLLQPLLAFFSLFLLLPALNKIFLLFSVFRAFPNYSANASIGVFSWYVVSNVERWVWESTLWKVSKFPAMIGMGRERTRTWIYQW